MVLSKMLKEWILLTMDLSKNSLFSSLSGQFCCSSFLHSSLCFTITNHKTFLKSQEFVLYTLTSTIKDNFQNLQILFGVQTTTHDNPDGGPIAILYSLLSDYPARHFTTCPNLSLSSNLLRSVQIQAWRSSVQHSLGNLLFSFS